MPITLAALKVRLDPAKTILLFGSGASIPSGAPSAADLAHQLWRKITKGEPQSDDLLESASILERRYGRYQVADEVRNSLKSLKASGGLLAIPQFPWSALYTTNFDRLVESSYKRSQHPLSVIRSNYDLTNKEARDSTTIYKLHGCITQDRSFGDKASMIITEDDYEQFERYRQTLFSNLQTGMLSNDVLVIGQSLRDPHLMALVRRVLSLKQEGVTSQIYLLTYSPDDLRAPLLEDKGCVVAFGGIDEFTAELSKEFKSVAPSRSTASADELPLSLVSCSADVTSALSQPPSLKRMFTGSPATYADIKSTSTFERSRHKEATDDLMNDDRPAVVLLGAAGVGKTTFARQIAMTLLENGIPGWEHKHDFPMNAKSWIEYSESLRKTGQRAFIFVDECTHFLRQVNILLEHLVESKNHSLKLICTANAAQWAPRIKSRYFHSQALNVTLSQLENPEINGLLNLYQRSAAIADLASKEFGSMSRERQFRLLRDRCSADMFVCLQNIFANQSLDTILLNEFEELEVGLQEYYRYVAALESVGTKVHRQLLMRMLSLGASQVEGALRGLTGIIDEYDIKPKDGIYGWNTRHIVIARIITDYKFSNYDELEKLFDAIIDNLNPAVGIELQSVRDLCDRTHGIGRLNVPLVRQRLYERLIDVADGERIPWHRLIGEKLENGSIEDADITLRNAVEAVGADGPLDRFRVRILVRRSRETKGISDADRLALVRRAYEAAEQSIRHHPFDKFAYRTLCDVASELVHRGESPYVLDEAISKMRLASEEILDPELDSILARFERQRAKM